MEKLSAAEEYDEDCQVTMVIPFVAETHELEELFFGPRGGYVAFCSCGWRSRITNREDAEAWWYDHVETERNRDLDEL